MWMQLICVLCPFVYTYIYTYTYIFCNIFPTTSCWNTRDSLGLVTSRPGLVYRRRPPSAPLPASHCTSGTMLCVCRVCVSYKWINKFFHCKDQMFYLFLFTYLFICSVYLSWQPDGVVVDIVCFQPTCPGFKFSVRWRLFGWVLLHNEACSPSIQ